MICDVFTPRGEPFVGDPRYVLRRQVERARKLGYIVNTGPELEFFLFRRDENGGIAPLPARSGRLLRLLDRPRPGGPPGHGRRPRGVRDPRRGGPPRGRGRPARDRLRVRRRAARPPTTRSPSSSRSRRSPSSTACTRRSCPSRSTGSTAPGCTPTRACTPSPRAGTRSPTRRTRTACRTLARSYMAGILAHARGMIAVLAPLVNSYKRLVPGYEAPTYLTWGRTNRSALIRVPMVSPGKSIEGTRAEVRCPDPVLEHLPRLRGDDRGRPRRRREGPAARRSGRGEPVRDGRRDDRREGDPGAAGHARARRSTSSRRTRSSATRSATTSSATSSRRSAPSGTSTAPRSPTGKSTATSTSSSRRRSGRALTLGSAPVPIRGAVPSGAAGALCFREVRLCARVRRWPNLWVLPQLLCEVSRAPHPPRASPDRRVRTGRLRRGPRGNGPRSGDHPVRAGPPPQGRGDERDALRCMRRERPHDA